jgi:hypothetical protein
LAGSEVGAATGGPCFAGAGAVAAGFTPFITDSPLARRDRYARVSELSMKITATAAVSLLKKVLPPVEPNRVCDDPPKRAPISAPLPFCRRTITIRARQTTIWKRTRIVCIFFSIPKVDRHSSRENVSLITELHLKFNNTDKRGRLEACPSHQRAVNVRHCHERIHIVRFDAATI